MLQSTFNDLEALKVAINIERRGERFYNLAADKLEDENEEAAAMLRRLAREETKHAKVFEELYSEALKHKDDFDDTYLFDPEVAAYFNNIVSSLIFPSDERQDELLADIDSVEDAIRLGIQAEKDSILFYTEMIAESKYEDAKKAFKKLLAQEKRHLRELQELLGE